MKIIEGELEKNKGQRIQPAIMQWGVWENFMEAYGIVNMIGENLNKVTIILC